MAFFTLEDLVGTAEVVVFPRDYEKWQRYLNEEAKIFVQGRVDAGDDRGAKIILEKVRSFEEIPKDGKDSENRKPDFWRICANLRAAAVWLFI